MPAKDSQGSAIHLVMTDRQTVDRFIWYFDEARCAVGKTAKKMWIDKIKAALDAWLEKQ